MKWHFALFAGLLATGTVVTAVVATPEQTIAARQSNFKDMGRAMKAIGEELKKPAPDLGVIRSSAQAISQASPRVSGAFGRGTGPEAGVKTQALPAIWQKAPEFRARINDFLPKTRDLQAAAGSGDLTRIRAAFPALGGTCKSCHDSFRARD